MADIISQQTNKNILAHRSLPTSDRLGATIPDDVDAKAVATQWFANFSKALEANDAKGVASLVLDDAFWRDMLAFTWNFRTFEGSAKIRQFLADVLPNSGISSLQLSDQYLTVERPYPDLAWIRAMFSFETTVGKGTGVFRLVPTANGVWKAHVVYTLLEEIKGHPERVGPLRDFVPNHGMWPEKRRREINFEDREPAVVIIGAGQAGLDLAARLKLLGVHTLVVEKQPRIGNQWRGRYEALCLHDPVWYDHMPYIPFPSSWPVWTPAPKLANWLESFAESMELDVWLGSVVTSLKQLPESQGQGWAVEIKREDGSTRAFKPRHIVFAHGFGGGVPNMPTYPGMDKFKGKIIHSSQHKSARDHVGKKVVVIGACTSGHDIAHDHYHHGVDVTIYQRSSTYIMTNKNGMPRLMKGFYWEGCPPVDIADRFFHSIPLNLLRLMHVRLTQDIAEADKELLEALTKKGFRIDFNYDGSGFLMKAYERGGGYYLDVGASQLIVDGEIGLKNDSHISHFSEKEIVFENGSTLPADVVIFATGYGDAKKLVAELGGEDLAKQYSGVWGFNAEGEVNGAWRWTEVPGLYHMLGNLAMCRFHSKQLALIIQGQELGVVRHGQQYSK